MTLFSIENLAQSDCKSSRTFSPQLVHQQQTPLPGFFPIQCKEEAEEAELTRPSSSESGDSVGAVSPSDGSSSTASSASDSPTSPKKPPHSYIALIAMAIIASPEKRLLLCDIYEYIMKRYPFFKDNERSWRNSIRHNLSLNECFIKAGRSGDGRGHFWAIHPANMADFVRGDYRRRQARRRVRAATYSPYAYPAAFSSAIPSGFVPMTYPMNFADVISKASLAMVPGFHPMSVSAAQYHPAGPGVFTQSPVPVSHPYYPAPAALHPDSPVGRLPVTLPSPAYSGPLPSTTLSPSSPPSDVATPYHIVHRSSPLHTVPYSTPCTMPTTPPSSWAPLSISKPSA